MVDLHSTGYLFRRRLVVEVGGRHRRRFGTRRVLIPRPHGAHEVTTVVVDTNQIVKRDWRIGRPWWSILLQLAASGQLRLVVPDLVVLEAVGRFRAELGKAEGTLKKLGIPIDLAAQVSGYEAGLRQTLRDASAEMPCDPPVTVSDLVGMAIGRELPFDQNGNGFRAAFFYSYDT